MQRLIIVHNSHSSKASKVCEEVLEPVREMPGMMVGKFEAYGRKLSENAKNLAKVLKNGDIVLTAGGDGTTEVGVNGILLSGKDVKLGVLGYGNFNDVARNFGFLRLSDITSARTVDAYAIECLVNGRHFQYAMGYFTAGMMADAARMLNSGAKRNHLRRGRGNTVFALYHAVIWYFENRKQKFLPDVTYNGVKMGDQTEYMAMNVRTVAKIMRVKPSWQNKKEFQAGMKDLKNFFKMAWFGISGVISGIKLRETRGDILEFSEPSKLVLQSEGECVEIEKVSKMEFRKADRPIKVFKI